MFGQHGTSPRKSLCRCSEKCLNLVDIVDEPSKCPPIDMENASPLFLANVLDMAETLAKVMMICGIHECKAKCAVDTTVSAFLHYDQVCNNSDPLVKKRIRREELYHDLGKKCLMNRVEAHLAYMIIKRGFKVFYYHAKEQLSQEPPCAKPSFPDECLFIHAAKRTTQDFARYDGLSCEEQVCVEYRIKKAYRKYYNRMQERTNIAIEEVCCKCCVCGKWMEIPPKGAPHPCKKKKKPIKGKCIKCCQLRKKRLAKLAKRKVKRKTCLDPLNPCTCGTKPLKLPWITSIWDWPDMKLYYEDIMVEKPPKIIDPCDEWPDPSWLKPMAGYGLPDEAACADWFDPEYLKHMEKETFEDQHLPTDDIEACREWPNPSWLKPLAGHSPPKEAACADWFDPDFSSFWKKPDMDTNEADESKPAGDVDAACKDWPDPSYLKPMAGTMPSVEAACTDWFDPSYLQHLSEKK